MIHESRIAMKTAIQHYNRIGQNQVTIVAISTVKSITIPQCPCSWVGFRMDLANEPLLYTYHFVSWIINMLARWTKRTVKRE